MCADDDWEDVSDEDDIDVLEALLGGAGNDDDDDDEDEDDFDGPQNVFDALWHQAMQQQDRLNIRRFLQVW